MTQGFHTTCPTCVTRLLVKDARLMGEILACPKCGSMVLVEAPEGYAPPAEASSAADPSEIQVTGSVESPSSVSPAESLPSAAGAGWLPLAAVGIGLLVVLGSVGWYRWQRLPQAETMELQPAGPVESTQLAAKHSQEESQDLSSELEPEESDPETQLEPSHTPESELPEEAVLVAEEIDPFEETREPAKPVANPAVSEPPHADVMASAASSNGLQQLAMLLGGETPPSNGSEMAESDAPYSASRPLVPLRPIDTSALSQHAIRQIRFERVPLVDFVRALGQLTNVPLSLDMEALELAGKLPTDVISFSKERATALEILQQSLAPLGLQPRLTERTLVVTVQSLSEPKLVSRAFFVGDLRGSDFDSAHFVATLVEPQSWNVVGGSGTIWAEGEFLHVQNSPLVCRRVEIFLERLRQARSLPSHSDLPSHLTSTEPRWRSLHSKLQRPIDVYHWDESPVLQILSAIEHAAELRILVDWEALAAVGVGPQTPAKLYVRNQPAETALQSLAESLQLPVDSRGLRPVCSDVVQWTSRNQAAVSFVDFYDFDRLNQASQVVVEQLMLRGDAAMDPVSGIAIVHASSEVHRSLLP